MDEGASETDISYAYCGYAPLSVRLVQMTKSLPRGWRSCTDALNLLYGPAELRQVVGEQGVDTRDPDQPSVVLVCFVGGVTYGEIAALRKLSELEDRRRQFLILTTEFINTKKMFTSLYCEHVFNQPIESTRSKPPEQRRGFFWGGR